MERKLAAIFSTDVKGYSRLMGDDEEVTIYTLKTYREVITNFIEQPHSRVVDSPGDNMLAEFASAVDAVKSAVAIQHELKTCNAELEAHRQMEFRIGLNVGDAIIDEGRLYGDGVNIAARLEGLADRGRCAMGSCSAKRSSRSTCGRARFSVRRATQSRSAWGRSWCLPQRGVSSVRCGRSLRRRRRAAGGQ